MTREPLRPFLSNVMLLLNLYSFLKNAGQGKKKLMTNGLRSISRVTADQNLCDHRTVAMIPNYVTVSAEMTAHPGREEDLKRHLLVLVEHTRQEEGCIQYDLHVSHDDPRKFVFVENWTTAEALDRHSKSAHMNAFRQVSAELRADPVVRTYTRIA